MRGPVRTYLRWRAGRALARYEPRVVTRTYAGLTLHIAIEDPVAEGWYDKDWPVMPEIAFLRGRGLEHGATVFDIGAHQGVVAMILANEVGPGKVIAIEAVGHNARLAELNRELNRVGNVAITNAAISDHNGETYVPTWELNAHVSTAPGAGLTAVPSVTIDTLAERHGAPAVVFVDVEGFEFRALRGAQTVLTQIRPTWLVEVHVGVGLEDSGSSAAEVLTAFADARYMTYGAPVDASQPFVPVTAGTAVSRSHFFLAAVPEERADEPAGSESLISK